MEASRGQFRSEQNKLAPVGADQACPVNLLDTFPRHPAHSGLFSKASQMVGDVYQPLTTSPEGVPADFYGWSIQVATERKLVRPDEL